MNKPVNQPAPEEVSASSQEDPVARIVSDKPREAMVQIDWPVEFDGKVWSEIRVKRCSAQEVDDYIESMKENWSPNNAPPFIDCPNEVWAAMDSDDRFKVDKVAVDFFPQRLWELMFGSSPGELDNTQDSSPKPSAPQSPQSSDGTTSE